MSKVNFCIENVIYVIFDQTKPKERAKRGPKAEVYNWNECTDKLTNKNKPYVFDAELDAKLFKEERAKAERLERIKSSLNSINGLMRQLKEQTEREERNARVMSELKLNTNKGLTNE